MRNIEHILFELLEIATPRLDDELFLEIKPENDPLSAKIIYCSDFPEHAKILLSIEGKYGMCHNSYTTVPVKSIDNFLTAAYIAMEKARNSEAIKIYGEPIISQIKGDVLDILSKKDNKRLELRSHIKDEFYITNHAISDFKSFNFIKINLEQACNHICPVEIRYDCMIEVNQKLSETVLYFYVPSKELKNYPLIPLKERRHQSEEDFIDQVIKNSEESSQSAILSKYSLENQLNKALNKTHDKKPKI